MQKISINKKATNHNYSRIFAADLNNEDDEILEVDFDYLKY